MEEPKEPEEDVLFQLYKLVASQVQQQEMASVYRQGGFGYGDVKKKLATAAEAYFGHVRENRQKWAERPDDVRDLLASGADRARQKAQKVLHRAQEACGLKGY